MSVKVEETDWQRLTGRDMIKVHSQSGHIVVLRNVDHITVTFQAVTKCSVVLRHLLVVDVVLEHCGLYAYHHWTVVTANHMLGERGKRRLDVR